MYHFKHRMVRKKGRKEGRKDGEKENNYLYTIKLQQRWRGRV